MAAVLGKRKRVRAEVLLEHVDREREHRYGVDQLAQYAVHGDRSSESCCAAFVATMMANTQTGVAPMRVVQNSRSSDTEILTAPALIGVQDRVRAHARRTRIPVVVAEDTSMEQADVVVEDAYEEQVQAVASVLEHIETSAPRRRRLLGEDVEEVSDTQSFNKTAQRTARGLQRRMARSDYTDPQNASAHVNELLEQTGHAGPEFSTVLMPEHLVRGAHRKTVTELHQETPPPPLPPRMTEKERQSSSSSSSQLGPSPLGTLAQQLLSEPPSKECDDHVQRLLQRQNTPKKQAQWFRASQNVGFAEALSADEDLTYVGGALTLTAKPPSPSATAAAAAAAAGGVRGSHPPPRGIPPWNAPEKRPSASELQAIQRDVPPIMNQAAYVRRFDTTDEAIQQMHEMLDAEALLAEQAASDEPVRRHVRMLEGAFKCDINQYVARELLKAPQPTVQQKSRIPADGMAFENHVPVARAVLEMYMRPPIPSLGERPCSKDTLCEGLLIKHEEPFILMESNFLPLMMLQHETEGDLDALNRVLQARQNARPDSKLLQMERQMCVICLLNTVQTSLCDVLGSNSSLAENKILCHFSVNVNQAGEFLEQDCVFPNKTKYTGLMGPVPIHTLDSYTYHMTTVNNKPMPSLRFVYESPQLDRNVDF